MTGTPLPAALPAVAGLNPHDYLRRDDLEVLIRSLGYVSRDVVCQAFAEMARDLQALPPRQRMNRMPQLVRELREKL